MYRRILMVLVIGVGLGLTACGSEGGASSRDSTLRWAISSAPRSLDTAHAFDGTSVTVINELLEPLVVVDPQGQLEPKLASSWRQTDAVTYVYTLRDDVTFWDGSPLTAEDVVFSIERHLDPAVASEYGTYVKDIASVTATGALEVTFTLKTAVPEFKYLVALFSHTVKKSFAEEHAENLGDSKTLTMGTGPYQATTFSADGVEVTRNEEYWGESPTWEAIRFDVIPDADTLHLAVDGGEVDGTFNVPLTSSRNWDTLSDTSVQYVDAPISTVLSMDTTAPPWNDVHLRRAVAHAIDRESIVASVFGGHGRVSQSIVDPSLWSFLGPDVEDFDTTFSDVRAYEYDLDKARAELAQSAHPDGISFTVTYPSGRASIGKPLQVMAASLKEVGITLTPKEVPASEWIGYIYAHKDLGAQILGVAADYPDPGVARLLLGKENAVPNAFNVANFTSPELEDLLEQERSADTGTRVEAIHQIAKIAAEEVPYVPLFFLDSTLALGKDLQYAGDFSYWTPLLDEWADRVQVRK
ncbi:ABC transporter substrate-binding protein [Nocardioides sp. L-11A]|uniref:ABC transporter substrate-binding protein n=1 Tax=Nocardioides sp. L-11A TaxID=3043848 RepID=UPI00249C8C37|nr:ABC transporter substrate-binding protein [Nocardioides sp. L-11A]